MDQAIALLEVEAMVTAIVGLDAMIKAANVKLTFERESGLIVNISGGGCPDVPYLAGLLVGRSLDDAEEPRLKGHTLCSYALQKAFMESRRMWEEFRKSKGEVA